MKLARLKLFWANIAGTVVAVNFSRWHFIGASFVIRKERIWYDVVFMCKFIWKAHKHLYIHNTVYTLNRLSISGGAECLLSNHIESKHIRAVRRCPFIRTIITTIDKNAVWQSSKINKNKVTIKCVSTTIIMPPLHTHMV